MLNPDQRRKLRVRPCRPLLLTLLLAGCAPLEWHKDGTLEEDLIRDQTRCTAEARSIAMRQHVPLRPPPQVMVDAQGRVIAVRPASPDTERFALEQDLMLQCMHELGYTLQRKSSTPTP